MYKVLKTFGAALLLTLAMASVASADRLKDYYADDKEQVYVVEKTRNGETSTQKGVLKSGPFFSRQKTPTQKVELLRYDGETLTGKTAYFHSLDGDTTLRFRLEISSARDAEVVRVIEFAPPFPSFSLATDADLPQPMRIEVSKDGDEHLRSEDLSFSAGRETITTAAGTYDCRVFTKHVEVDGKKLYKQTEWRAKGFGLVKLVQESEDPEKPFRWVMSLAGGK